MDWLLLIVEFASIIAVFLLGLFTKNYLPSYMEKKGENLATKEDVKEITRRTEEVQQEFRQEMARFSKDLEFKYDFYYKQYDGLYSFLYAIVSQSEYTKHIIKLTDGRELTFDEYPFVKISPTRTVKTTYEIGKTTHQETLTETEISEFDQKKICEYIISNGHLATPELLKLAVSYRLVYDKDGKLLSKKKEANSYYKGHEAIIAVGTMKVEQAPEAQPEATPATPETTIPAEPTTQQ